MAIDLSTLTFTNQADIVPASGTDQIINTGTANTLAGNDKITGTNPATSAFGSAGIINRGIIKTGSGQDTITGTSVSNNDSSAIANDPNSTIDTGTESDTIIGTLTSAGSAGGNGITNGGTIKTGSGADIITGIGSGSNSTGGIANYLRSSIINTGSEDDIITGSGVLYGIQNNGTINTCTGDDIVDASTGGFTGSGRVILGDGDDIVKGFGSGHFDGGTGYDKLQLTTGTYTVGISGSNVSFSKSGVVMNTTLFEQLIAGSARYSFSSLTNGQVITV